MEIFSLVLHYNFHVKTRSTRFLQIPTHPHHLYNHQHYLDHAKILNYEFLQFYLAIKKNKSIFLYKNILFSFSFLKSCESFTFERANYIDQALIYFKFNLSISPILQSGLDVTHLKIYNLPHHLKFLKIQQFIIIKSWKIKSKL